MSDYLAQQQNIFPPGFRPQVIIHEDGKLETLPIGTTGKLSYLSGLGYREKMVKELTHVLEEQYGFGYDDLMVLCYDIDGNECVVIKSRRPPPGVKPKLSDDNNHSSQLRIENHNTGIIDI